MSINVTWDAPDWVSINRGKLSSKIAGLSLAYGKLVLLAAYEINERSGALIDRLEESNEGQRPKARAKARRSRG